MTRPAPYNPIKSSTQICLKLFFPTKKNIYIKNENIYIFLNFARSCKILPNFPRTIYDKTYPHITQKKIATRIGLKLFFSWQKKCIKKRKYLYILQFFFFITISCKIGRIYSYENYIVNIWQDLARKYFQ